MFLVGLKKSLVFIVWLEYLHLTQVQGGIQVLQVFGYIQLLTKILT